jgi:hypothetical protein
VDPPSEQSIYTVYKEFCETGCLCKEKVPERMIVSFENMTNLKYFGTIVSNRKYIHEDIRSKLNKIIVVVVVVVVLVVMVMVFVATVVVVSCKWWWPLRIQDLNLSHFTVPVPALEYVLLHSCVHFFAHSF